jgi:hypothetical protein
MKRQTMMNNDTGGPYLLNTHPDNAMMNNCPII